MFHVPNLISTFHSLGCLPKESIQVRGSLQSFSTSLFSTVRVGNATPCPQAGEPFLVCCPWLLIQFIRSYLPQLEAVSSIHNLRMHPAMLRRDHNLLTILIMFGGGYKLWRLSLFSFSNILLFHSPSVQIFS
jgi:hypothetical protein